MPWGPDVYHTAPVAPETGWINHNGYLALWTLNTLLDAQKTLEYLAYLGYNYHTGEESQISALQITRWVIRKFNYCRFLGLHFQFHFSIFLYFCGLKIFIYKKLA